MRHNESRRRPAWLLATLAALWAAGARAASFDNAVLIGWDGADRKVVRRMLAAGELPNLAALVARGGIADTQVTTGATETKPGWTEILTGRNADQLGIEDNFRYKPIPPGDTIFELLKSRFKGLATIFLVAKTNNLADRGPHEICINCITRLPGGGDKTLWWDKSSILPKTRTVHPPESLDPAMDPPQRWAPREGEPYHFTVKSVDEYKANLGAADNVGREALEALRRYKNSRFFAFFHFEDPDELGHVYGEGTPPYLDGIRTADKWLGRIVAELKTQGLYDRTAVFVTSDHGFDKWQKGHRFAPDTFFATSVKRPLRAGDRKDVTPTILAAMGVDPAGLDPQVEGRSLFDARASARPAACPGCSVIFLSLSNVGAARMSLYGYPRKTTPRLDAWARGAVVFEQAFSPASWTLPVGASVFTGMHPYAHRLLWRTANNVLSPAIKTLPELLQARGYRTAAFTGGLDYDARFSQMRGFQDKAPNEPFSGFGQTIPQAKAWLAKNGGDKFFLFVHGYDAHCPYRPSPRFKGLFTSESNGLVEDPTHCVRGFEDSASSQTVKAFEFGFCGGGDFPARKCQPARPVTMTGRDLRYFSDLYDEKLVEVDSLVGEFLEGLDKDLLKRTIVVVFSDHGEMFERHGRFGRAGNVRGTLYDDVVRVPLMILFPDAASKRVSGLVELSDLMPTVLNALGVDPPRMQGVDLTAAMAAGASDRRYVYADAAYNNACAPKSRPLQTPFNPYPHCTQAEAIRDNRWKLIRELYFEDTGPAISPAMTPVKETVELYDLKEDSDERRDLAAQRPEVAGELAARLSAWKKEAEAFAPGARGTESVPADLMEKARARGYW